MAQFDVHRNKGALRDSIPFVVVVQSAQFDRYRRRVVVPLVRQSLLPRDTPTVGARMNPAFVIDGVPVKSYPYNHRLEILEQARRNGFDEALVTSFAGKICEGAVCNVLLKIAGKWCTPPLSDGVLPGVMRALVIENFDVMVRSIDVSEIADIECAFLLSSLRIAQPIAAIDGRKLSQSHQFRDEIEAMALRTSVG